jgi:hypothetical protein
MSNSKNTTLNIMLSVAFFVVMLDTVVLSAATLNVYILGVVMLNVKAPFLSNVKALNFFVYVTDGGAKISWRVCPWNIFRLVKYMADQRKV